MDIYSAFAPAITIAVLAEHMNPEQRHAAAADLRERAQSVDDDGAAKFLAETADTLEHFGEARA